ncbi:hypothetical protein ASPZODRAFT_151756 [Penicilliopsis zonata CBS 506.65]|uniref:C3H1-type domain-containing protein n=1 Tax=Penicilliopsis zonata CBS 506.65 TaxID=1073090 RepID=A0A1L9SJ36_9EURO|nr:hypothetical protein ASPZODRAFT_151756 [Penicilliopsis zonata CBS 506.65]OJJ47230.1 hypothetical protein ASPZODRAFT_151756 [Penicilliopsis zonata CBS 506.65]
MQFSEEEAAEVKKWVVKKLEDILDTASFVDELFDTFAPKTTAAPPVAPQPQLQLGQSLSHAPQQSLGFNPSSGPAGGPRSGPENGAGMNRKRTFQEGFQADQERDDTSYTNRTFKTPRRGRGGGRGDWPGRDGRPAAGMPPGAAGQFPGPAAAAAGGFPVMPPGFPPFDQNDPMAAMMALQSMGFPQMPGMPPLPMPPAAGGPPLPDQMTGKSSQRCPFYETQGICYLGAACPYTHEQTGDHEYDPKSSSIVMDGRRNQDGGYRGGRGRGRGGGDRGGFAASSRGRGGGRSDYSAAGPNEDRSITTIVVEQIPEDKFDEGSVREFFSQYGDIVDITLQPPRRLALVKYDSYDAAKRAWSSPKVIFDNRFVKVYWHKPSHGRSERPDGGPAAEDPAFDPEQFQRQQDEAQRAHEEKLKKRKETEAAKLALERQREELFKKQQEEKARLMQRLSGKNLGASSNGTTPDVPGDMDTAPDDGEPMTGGDAADENVSEQTKQLRAQLAALEAEAKSLGIDPENGGEPGAGSTYRGRGSRGAYAGSYRARGSFVPRGRGGYDPSSSSSSYRGRGRGGITPRGRGGVLRLDNRPRRVAVSGVQFDSDKDEALRQYLIGIGEYESIEQNPNQPDSLIVAFKERYLAEKFMFSPWAIPSVGEVQLSWVANPPIAFPATTQAGVPEKNAGDEEMDSAMDSMQSDAMKKDGAAANEVDYDVAEDEDNWG